VLHVAGAVVVVSVNVYISQLRYVGTTQWTRTVHLNNIQCTQFTITAVITSVVVLEERLCHQGPIYKSLSSTWWLGGLLVERRTSVSQIRGSIPGQVAAV